MIKIRVIVNGHATVPPSLGKQLIGRLVLDNGENWVDSDLWNEVKDLPLVRQKIDKGLIIVPGEGNKQIIVPQSQSNRMSPQIVTEQVTVGEETISIPVRAKSDQSIPVVDTIESKPVEQNLSIETEYAKVEAKATDLTVEPKPELNEPKTELNTVEMQPTKAKKTTTSSETK